MWSKKPTPSSSGLVLELSYLVISKNKILGVFCPFIQRSLEEHACLWAEVGKIFFSGTKLSISPNLSHSSLFQIDILGLIVACISHDLDHRGTNNSFQHKMNNPLAKLYSTSTLERHHLNQCLLILTLRGNQILDNLTKVQDGNYEYLHIAILFVKPVGYTK